MTDEGALFSPRILALAASVLDRARNSRTKLAVAESCTGGLVCAALTEIAGSSEVLERGFVTYSNLAKQTQLGVPAHMIADRGAVSDAVARAMVEGALAAAPSARIAVSITGVAGPGGGTLQKPVGLVHFACAVRGRPTINHAERFGDLGRTQVRLAAVEAALSLLTDALAV